MKTNYLLGIVLVIFIGVLGYAFVSRDSSSAPAAPAIEATQSDTTTSGATNTAPSASQSYTMAEVGQHNSASSCWTAINGNVYDVTDWINRHPGGAQAILSLCGTNGTTAFNNQHGGQARPESELATFLIGSLAQ